MTGWIPHGPRDWREILATRLVGAGTRGLAHSDLLRSVTMYTVAAEVNEHLEILRLERKVDKYTVPSRSGKAATHWRATVKLLGE